MTAKIVQLGPGCYFPDSLVYFQELGHEVYVLKIPRNIVWNERNYETHRDLHFSIIDVDRPEIDDVKRAFDIIQPDANTLFLGGGFFGGHVPVLEPWLNGSDQFQLELLYQVSRAIEEEHTRSKCIRYFNGDTGWGSQRQRDLFAEKTHLLDAVLFDNSLLQDFVLYNIPEFEGKRQLICQLERPLKRFVKVNHTTVDKRIGILGRWVSSVFHRLSARQVVRIPHWRCFLKMFGRRRFFMSGNRPLDTLLRDRASFQARFGTLSFGLSHIYDVLSGSKEFFLNNREFCFSLPAQQMTWSAANADNSRAHYIHPVYYGYTNTANKDINCLMYGIVPILPHDVNPFNQELLEKGMAVKIDSIDELSDLLTLDDEVILSMKRNIANNAGLFTFEPEADKILAWMNAGSDK